MSKGLLYSRAILVWVGLAVLGLDVFSVYHFLTTPFEWVFLLAIWILIGLNIVLTYMGSILWDTEFEM
jgi:hypothetical protein